MQQISSNLSNTGVTLFTKEHVLHTYLYFKMEVPSMQFRTMMSTSNIAEDKLRGKYITCMWSCMKGHDTVHSCMVYTEHAEIAAVSCSTSHVTTKQCWKYITLVDIQKCTIRCSSHLIQNQSIFYFMSVHIEVILDKKNKQKQNKQKTQL